MRLQAALQLLTVHPTHVWLMHPCWQMGYAGMNSTTCRLPLKAAVSAN